MIRSWRVAPMIVEVGLHQRLGGDARRGRGERQAQILDVESGPQPERAHEYGLPHAVDLPQGRPVGVRRDGAILVDLRMEDLADDAVDAAHGEPHGPAQAADAA